MNRRLFLGGLLASIFGAVQVAHAKKNKVRKSRRPGGKTRRNVAIATLAAGAVGGAGAVAAAPKGVLTAGESAGLHLTPDPIGLRSAVALIVDNRSGQVLLDKNSGAVLPIASLTKIMMAMVVLDAKLNLNESVEVTREDLDLEKFSRSRLPIGSVLSREELLQLALMSSENRAASALARQFDGGKSGFVKAMNRKAQELGMLGSQFADASGLSAENRSSAVDLLKMVFAADKYPLIRQFSVAHERQVNNGKRPINFGNSNRLVKSDAWNLRLQKTGFTSEAGSCLILHGKVEDRPVTIILLDGVGRLTKFGDAHRIREWLRKQA
jgi:serine-type D-Ala-D-Ala endopeptidase (penicillin-binding protein 7)